MAIRSMDDLYPEIPNAPTYAGSLASMPLSADISPPESIQVVQGGRAENF